MHSAAASPLRQCGRAAASSTGGNGVAKPCVRRGPRPRSETTHLETLMQRLARDGEERLTVADKKVLFRTVKKEVQRRAKVRARARSRVPCDGGGAAPPPRAAATGTGGGDL